MMHAIIIISVGTNRTGVSGDYKPHGRYKETGMQEDILHGPYSMNGSDLPRRSVPVAGRVQHW